MKIICGKAKILISEMDEISTDEMKALEMHLSSCKNCRGVKKTLELFE